MQPVIFLFDLDGVLVQPGGYRAAVRATVHHFAQHLGLPEAAPDENALAVFESQGITGEWDMIPLSLAILLDAAAAHLPDDAGESLEMFRARARQHPVAAIAVDYPKTIRQMGAHLQPGEAPSDRILALVQAGADAHLFPRLSGRPVLSQLLAHTRSLAHAPTTRIFEQLVLGHVVYQQSLEMPAEIESESFLALHDRPLLQRDARDRLAALAKAGKLHMAAYTARPSGWHTAWPDGAGMPAMFAPEAEMALSLAGLDAIPLVGYGQMGGLALQLNLREEALVKPSPYHSMAAIAAAWTGDQSAALHWLRGVLAGQPGDGQAGLDSQACVLPPAADVHIFEDSSIGMAGGKQAVELLRGMGAAVRLHLWGVTTHEEKAAALQAVGAQVVFADVNQAVDHALRASGLEPAAPLE